MSFVSSENMPVIFDPVQRVNFLDLKGSNHFKLKDDTFYLYNGAEPSTDVMRFYTGTVYLIKQNWVMLWFVLL